MAGAQDVPDMQYSSTLSYLSLTGTSSGGYVLFKANYPRSTAASLNVFRVRAMAVRGCGMAVE